MVWIKLRFQTRVWNLGLSEGQSHPIANILLSISVLHHTLQSDYIVNIQLKCERPLQNKPAEDDRCMVPSSHLTAKQNKHNVNIS